ncbi:MAG: glycosyltransferase family 4 protein [Bacteroidetes bacterium]|nr:glycosyltransferase family 4 protein [Bacteroidota bacterium]
MPGLIRITTVPESLQFLLKGQMKFMQQHGFEVTMISADGAPVKDLVQQEGCTHIVVPFTRKITPVTDVKCMFQLVRIFRKLKPAIVHTHTPKAGLVGMWAAKLAGVPVRLHTIAGLPWMETTGIMRTILRIAEKLTAMPASYIYPNSNKLQSFLKEQGVANGKMKVLGQGSSNGIDSTYFSVTNEIQQQAEVLKQQTGLKEDGWVWIFVGRLVKDKGIGELLDAFNEVHTQYPNDQLWLLGTEEPELDPLDEQHKQLLHTHPAITCWGFQKDIRPYLAASNILAFPSYREGFPNVPMQAGLMGCMLILSDINGCNEIVDHEKNGLLVPVKNTMALQQAMFQSRQSPATTAHYAQQIRKKIVEGFDQQQLWKLILQEYQYWLTKKKISLPAQP